LIALLLIVVKSPCKSNLSFLTIASYADAVGKMSDAIQQAMLARIPVRIVPPGKKSGFHGK
jgi:hypothetical protein